MLSTLHETLWLYDDAALWSQLHQQDMPVRCGAGPVDQWRPGIIRYNVALGNIGQHVLMTHSHIIPAGITDFFC